jgi:hypothetical protein
MPSPILKKPHKNAEIEKILEKENFFVQKTKFFFKNLFLFVTRNFVKNSRANTKFMHDTL